MTNMKNQKHYEDQFDELMTAVSKFINDPVISDFNKKNSVVNMINWAISNSCTTYMECMGMFECAKDDFKKNEELKSKAENN